MKHVLVVDDNPADGKLAGSLLESQADLHVEFASNGLDALEHLESETPLAVISDIQMPEMDGLALVKQMRRLYPSIPVILMTEPGSEDTAVEALVEGAADYVPKHRLSQDLTRTVREALASAAGDRRHERISSLLRFEQLQYVLPSDIELIPPLVDQLQQTVTKFNLIHGAARFQLAKCLAEALRNGIIHGNLSEAARTTSGEERRLFVDVVLTPEEVRFVIRDEGPGFDSSAVVDPRETPSLLSADGGKGLALIQLFMDEVTFNSRGNEIRLVKRRTEAR